MKIITKILSLIVVAVLLQATAAAHTVMTSASPENGAVLTQSPPTFEVSYSKAVRLVKMTLTGSNDQKIRLPQKLAKAISTDHRVKLPTLAVGMYKLSWILMGKDGHKMKGKVSFSVTGNQ